MNIFGNLYNIWLNCTDCVYTLNFYTCIKMDFIYLNNAKYIRVSLIIKPILKWEWNDSLLFVVFCSDNYLSAQIDEGNCTLIPKYLPSKYCMNSSNFLLSSLLKTESYVKQSHTSHNPTLGFKKEIPIPKYFVLSRKTKLIDSSIPIL